MPHDAKQYWKKRTLRIIGDLEEALLECKSLKLLHGKETIRRALKAIRKTLSEGT